MTPQKAKILVAFTLIVTAISVGVIYHRYKDDELSVYVAFFEAYKHLPGMNDVAFISTTTTCNVTSARGLLQPQLFVALREANKTGTSPRPLEQLSNLANVVSWQATKLIHSKGGYFLGGNLAGKRLVRISRVGFNEAHTKAVLCVEPGRAGNLIFFERDWGGVWRKVGEETAWVS